MQPRSRLPVFVGYALLVGLVVAAMVRTRKSVLTRLDSPAAQLQWQTWQDDVRQQTSAQSASVSRRIPKSDEPPALVLMRDYFVVCLTGALLFSSLLYWTLAFFAVGAAATEDDQSASGVE